MTEIIKLKLYGPYKFCGCENKKGVFDSEISHKKGIYFWTVKFKDGYLIDYIGKTVRNFRQRMKEHLIHTFGGNYRICDSELLRQGKEKILWNGLWRKGTRDKMCEFIKKLENEEFVNAIKRYVEIHDIFLAPFEFNKDDNWKKRQLTLIEGNLAKIIKESEPPISNLLPKDVRYVYRRKPFEKEFIVEIECAKNILGLPKKLKI